MSFVESLFIVQNVLLLPHGLILTFALLSWITTATTWFFIGRGSRVRSAWLAFIPLVGFIVPYRSAHAPRWTLIGAIVSTLTTVLSILFLIGALFYMVAIGLAAWGARVEAPPVVVYGVAVASVLFIIALVITTSILTNWTIRVAREYNYSTFFGLLATPLAFILPVILVLISYYLFSVPRSEAFVFETLIPALIGFGVIVRLIFLGIIAFAHPRSTEHL
ncbi:MAG: hypothetical protein ACMXYM_01650 [Candidatus Woesearchaeota archaeon]